MPYVASGLGYILVSIGGATQPLYERFRKNGDIRLVFRNIQKLVAARDRARSKFPVLAWQFLAFEHNRHEIPAAIQKATELGVNEMRIVEPFEVSWDDPSLEPVWNFPGEGIELKPVTPGDYCNNWNRFPDEVPAKLLPRAFDDGWPNEDAGPFEPSSSGHTCHWPYMNSGMDASGRILPCSCAPTSDRKLVFGQLDPADSGADPVDTPRHQSARACFATGVKSAPLQRLRLARRATQGRHRSIPPRPVRRCRQSPILDAATPMWRSDWTS